jgi:hypothetical protein
VAVRAETLFAPGTINIATNQAIVITTPPYLDSSGYAVDFDLDGVPMQFNTPWPNGQYWIAGPHSLTLTNRCFVTFQRLEGSALKTVVCLTPSTNSIHVPVGKTIQLLRGTVNASLQTVAVSTNSPDPYPVNFGLWGAALSGPCDISLIQGDSGGNPLFVSYYFTGEVL